MSRMTLTDALNLLGDGNDQGYSAFYEGATEAQKTNAINQAMELLIGQPSWRGIDVLSTFVTYNNQITLPRSLQAVKKAAVPPGGSGFTDVPINTMWFQFHINGPGLIDPDNPFISKARFNDLGLGYVTFLDPTAAFKIKIVSDVNEAASTVLTFFGTDVNGNVIYSGTDEGVSLDADASPATTTQVFLTLNKVVKPVTFGRIKVYAVDNVTSVATLMAIYEPGETTPCYRRYYVTGRETETRTFTALCKRNYVPCVTGNDQVFPDSWNALEAALEAIRYRKAGDGNKYQEFKKIAIDILNDELGEYMADLSPAIQIQNRCNAGRTVRNLR